MELPKTEINYTGFELIGWQFQPHYPDSFLFKSPRMVELAAFYTFSDGLTDEDLLRAEISAILVEKGRFIDKAIHSAKGEILSDFSILLKRNIAPPSRIEFTVKVEFPRP